MYEKELEKEGKDKVKDNKKGKDYKKIWQINKNKKTN